MRMFGWLVVVPSLAGCAFVDIDDEIDEVEEQPADPVISADGALIVERALQIGDLGDVVGYASDARPSGLTYSGNRASMRLDSEGDRWWVMNRLDIFGIDLVSAEPGTYGTGDIGSAALGLSVTGCSGPGLDSPNFELRTIDVEVTIADVPGGGRTLDYVAVYDTPDGEQQIGTGTVAYRAGDIPPASASVVVSDATQEGSLGAIEGYRSSAAPFHVYYEPDHFGVRLDSIGEGWWVATELSVTNLDIFDAPAGTYTHATETDRDALHIHARGQSGARYEEESFISGADQTEMTIRDNPDGSRTIDVTATYLLSGRPQTTRTSFRVSRG
jgi:hypothetical protein